jgi:HK97 family phage prohead protease
MIHLKASFVSIDAAADNAETPKRSISGLAVPWNVDATVLGGQVVRFLPGSLPETGPAPKLLEEHAGLPIGLVTERVSTEEGMMFVAKLAENNTRANDAMALLTMGAIDAVSVGAIPTAFKYDKNGTMVVSKADFVEISLVTAGAFSDARIYDVAATAQRTQEGVWVEVPNEQEEEESTPTPTPPTEEKEIPMSESPEVVEATTPTPIFATAKREFKLPTAAEYISALLCGGDQWQAMSANIRAAAPDIVSNDNPGTLPISVVAPVYNNFQGRRPVCDAVGVRGLPQGGKVFIRPEVTTHTSIGASISEQSPTGGTLVVSSNQVTKQLFGGYVNISEFDIDVSQPEILQVVLDDMARIYANATDNYAADQLATGATVTRNFAGASYNDPSYWVSWVSGAAQTILSSSNGNLPTHLFVNPEWWGFLLQLSDSSERPLFPQIGPMNAFGNLAPGQVNGVAFGLQVVVDRNFPADTLIVGDASGYELYEMQKGAISIDSPSTLSRTVAFRGQFAALMIDNTKFIKAVIV